MDARGAEAIFANRSDSRKGEPESLDPRSKDFLIDLFTALLADLEDDLRGGGIGTTSSFEGAAGERVIYRALLNALEGGGPFPDDEQARWLVAGLARAADEGNQYEQAALEHQAFAELDAALGGGTSDEVARGAG
jgi:hypothetical protein